MLISKRVAIYDSFASHGMMVFLLFRIPKTLLKLLEKLISFSPSSSLEQNGSGENAQCQYMLVEQ